MDNMWPVITEYGVKIVGVLVFFVVALKVARWAGRVVTAKLEKSGKLDGALTKFFGNVTRILLVVMAVLAALGVVGVETTSFAALIGGAGLAIGLAFQGTLANFAAGIMLLVFRPFRLGDVITVAGEMGKVFEIGLFVTLLDTPDNRRIILPNKVVFGGNITNATHHDTRRVDVSVGTDYPADLKDTRAVLEAAARSVDGILAEPNTQVFLAGLGDSCIDWQVRVWAPTAAYWDVYQDLTFKVKVALDEAGIGIPYPQTDVHLDGALVNALGAGAGPASSPVPPKA